MKELAYRLLAKLRTWYVATEIDKLRQSLRFCGARVWFGQHVIIWGSGEVILEEDVAINSFTHIFGAGGVRIGARTLISAGCSIASVTHAESLDTRRHGILQPVVIEEDCWLGTGAIILPGVRVGRGSIIAAGAVVTKDVPPFSIAMGVPARVTRQIKSRETEHE